MQVRRDLGYQDPAQTYIQLMAQTLTGATPPTQLTETVTALVFVVSVIVSIALNVRDMRRAKRAAHGPQEL
jgi:hypothetical protein